MREKIKNAVLRSLMNFEEDFGRVNIRARQPFGPSGIQDTLFYENNFFFY